MCELFKDFPDLLRAVDWGVFGFEGRDGKQSTIWIGSDGASTPCHMDTYGCNLVAQIYGKKKWTLFTPSETHKLYPTRLPYEESSIFSQVNVTSPDLHTFPEFAKAEKHEASLEISFNVSCNVIQFVNIQKIYQKAYSSAISLFSLTMLWSNEFVSVYTPQPKNDNTAFATFGGSKNFKYTRWSEFFWDLEFLRHPVV